MISRLHIGLILVCFALVPSNFAQDLRPPDAEAILNPQGNTPIRPAVDQSSMPVFSDVAELAEAGVGKKAASSPVIKPAPGLVEAQAGSEVGTETRPDAAPVEPPAVPMKSNPGTETNPPKGDAKAAGDAVAPVNTTHLEVPLNVMWVLLTGFLVMFMQAGFAMVETGFTRAKNVAHTMAMNFMVYAVAMLGWTGAATSVSTVVSLGSEVGEHLNSLIGFEFEGKFFGLIGNAGYMLAGDYLYGGIFTLFLFQMVFMDTAATIPTGAMAERFKFVPFLLTSLIIGSVIYPIYACWVWGGGWLAALGKNFGLGHGHVDFAGSSVVHLCGGVLAFVGAALLGPRYGKYNKDGSANPIPGHNLSLGFLGTFVLAFGWFGFNAGSTLSGFDQQIGVIATNTMLAGAAGAVTGMLMSWVMFHKPDPSFMCNGMLAGLVAITAPCAFVDAWVAVTIGASAGILVVVSVLFVERTLLLDDPVGAISVHGVCGLWGCLALGLFANGKYGEGWNGVEGKVTGLLYGDSSQILAQLIGVGSCIIAVGLMSFIMFGIVKLLIGLRVDVRDEIAGLDLAEMGALGYQPDLNPDPR
jgi:ammonium transporter, Amt family